MKNNTSLTPQRRRPNKTRITGSGEKNLLKYSALGATVTTSGTGDGWTARGYVPGNATTGLNVCAGASIAALYQTGVFRPGTKVTWTPNLGMTASGRIYMAFVDNSESIYFYDSNNQAVRSGMVKSTGNMVSGHIAQELTFTIPSNPRRKRFDSNATTALTDVDIIERSCQGALIFGVDGCPADTVVGQMHYHDVLEVEGIAAVTT
jgi:hypothetical protein